MVRTIPFNGQSPKGESSGQFQLIVSIQNQLSRQLQLRERLRNQLCGQFHLIDSITNQLPGQFQLIQHLWNYLSRQCQLVDRPRNQLPVQFKGIAQTDHGVLWCVFIDSQLNTRAIIGGIKSSYVQTCNTYLKFICSALFCVCLGQ